MHIERCLFVFIENFYIKHEKKTAKARRVMKRQESKQDNAVAVAMQGGFLYVLKNIVSI